VVAYSPSGNLLAVAGAEQIELWDLRSGKQTPGSPIHFPRAGSLSVCFGDKWLAAGNYAGKCWSGMWGPGRKSGA